MFYVRDVFRNFFREGASLLNIPLATPLRTADVNLRRYSELYVTSILRRNIPNAFIKTFKHLSPNAALAEAVDMGSITSRIKRLTLH